MKKTVAAFLLGMMLGIKGISKVMHLVYWCVILALWFRPAHAVWSLYHPAISEDVQFGILAVVGGLGLLFSLVLGTWNANRGR